MKGHMHDKPKSKKKKKEEKTPKQRNNFSQFSRSQNTQTYPQTHMYLDTMVTELQTTILYV